MPGIEMAPAFTKDEREDEFAAMPGSGMEEPVSALAGYVKACWTAARDSKMTGVLNRIVAAQRRLRGEYSLDKKAKIQRMGGSTIYMRLADEKATAAKSWLTDTILPADEEPFGVEGSPIPEIPEDLHKKIQQSVVQSLQRDVQIGVEVDPIEIENRVLGIESEVYNQMREIVKDTEAAIEAKIEDVVVESKWRKALEEMIMDMVDFPCGFLKGPIYRKRRVVVWEDGRAVTRSETVTEFESPSPYDIYPSPSSRGISDGYLIEKHSLRRKDLVALRGVEGYDEEVIEQVLQEHGSGGLDRWIYEAQDSTRHLLAERPDVTRDPEATIDALQFWGSVQGLFLLEHGTSSEDIAGDVYGEFDVEVWLIGNYVLKCAINENPLGKRPYYKASYRERKGQFWGDGVVDLVGELEDMCNATARNLVNNMGITSGPQIGVDTDAMPPGEAITTITPLKVWQFKMKDVMSGTRPPMWFFQPKSVISELTKVYEFFSAEADHKTGIPKYSYTQQGSGGAMDTATGFSMMMSNTSRLFKQVIRNVDCVIAGSIQAIHDKLILTDEDPVWLKSDVKPVARGTSSLISKEAAQVRRNEFLQIISNNPVLLEIVGKEGLAEILRLMASSLDIGRGRVVPSREEIKREAFAMSQAQQGGSGRQQLPPPAAGGGGVGASPGAQTNAAGMREGGADVRQF